MNNYFVEPYSPDDIMHFGVKGMKWGVRRYENKDGSLTPLGKRRQQAYEEYQNNVRNTYKEANKLFKNSKVLRNQFGNSSFIDKYKLGDKFANRADFHGLNTKSYRDARNRQDNYYSNNRSDIRGYTKYLKKKKKIPKNSNPIISLINKRDMKKLYRDI